MDRYVKVENEKNLVRDMNTNAILETDLSKLHRHRAISSAMAAREEKINSLSEEINTLKGMFKELTERVSHGINNN